VSREVILSAENSGLVEISGLGATRPKMRK